MKTAKKILIGIAGVCAALILSLTVDIGLKKRDADRKLHEHLREQGISDADISRYSIRYCFPNVILGYDPWRIDVVFADEPDVTYSYSCWNGSVTQGDVRGERIKTKEDEKKLKHIEWHGFV